MERSRWYVWTAGMVIVLALAVGSAVARAEINGPLLAGVVWAGCLAFLARTSPYGLLSLECLYLALLGLFHLGLVVPAALGLRPERVHSWTSSPQLGTALGLFTAATLSLTLGARLIRRDGNDAPGVVSPRPILFGVGLTFAIAGAALLWTGILQQGLLSIGHADYYEQSMTEDTRLFGFGLMLFPIGLIVAAVAATPRGMLGLAAVFACVLGPVFLAGFRGPALVQGAAFLAVWVRKDARTAKRLAAGGVVALFLLVPAVKITRNASIGLSDALREAEPLEFLYESGGSLHPLVVTSERIESEGERLWTGRSYLMAAKRLVPNVSSAWAAPSQRALTPAAWATMHADFWAFEHGLGIGFSGVAEPYLNFGAYGVVLFFILLGWVLGVGNRWLSAGGERAAIVAASFGFVLWTVRNDMMAVPRAITLASVAVGVAWLVSRLLDRRANSRNDDPAASGASWRVRLEPEKEVRR